MSYEGVIEYLCEKGHHLVVDCYEKDPSVCHCGAKLTHRHSIDYTNGVDEDDPYACEAPKKISGYEEKTIKIPLFEAGEHWIEIK